MKKRLNRFVVATRRRIGRETSDSHELTAARVQAEEGCKKDIVQTVSLLASAFNGGRRFLRRRYSSVLPAPPPSQSARPLSHERCQLILSASPLGLPVLRRVPFWLQAVASILAGLIETNSLIRFHQPRPSSKPRVDSCIRLFEACSGFTHLTVCLLAWSPLAAFCSTGFSSLVASTVGLMLAPVFSI